MLPGRAVDSCALVRCVELARRASRSVLGSGQRCPTVQETTASVLQHVPLILGVLLQAFLHKHAPRNSRHFFPESLRELAPTERLGGEAVNYVKLEGLGKIAFSSIRRPKPLMEFGAPEGEGNSRAGHQLQNCTLCS